jgi:hypothetical protein
MSQTTALESWYQYPDGPWNGSLFVHVHEHIGLFATRHKILDARKQFALAVEAAPTQTIVPHSATFRARSRTFVARRARSGDHMFAMPAALATSLVRHRLSSLATFHHTPTHGVKTPPTLFFFVVRPTLRLVAHTCIVSRKIFSAKRRHEKKQKKERESRREKKIEHNNKTTCANMVWKTGTSGIKKKKRKTIV